MRLIIAIVALATVVPAQSQFAPDTLAAPDFASGVGGALLLTNHGFGLGAVLRVGIGPTTTVFVEMHVGAGKDEREQEFFVGPFGETVTPFKRNYFAMLPLSVGIEQRVWADAIEDDFRPFVQGGVGPVLGYQWPYFEDNNENGIRDPGEPTRGPFDLGGGSLRLGIGGMASFGAHFGETDRSVVGLRIGYAIQYFPEPVDLLEPRPEIERPSKRFFGSPVVTLQLTGL